jgi:hypothetical protein
MIIKLPDNDERVHCYANHFKLPPQDVVLFDLRLNPHGASSHQLSFDRFIVLWAVATIGSSRKHAQQGSCLAPEETSSSKSVKVGFIDLKKEQ